MKEKIGRNVHARYNGLLLLQGNAFWLGLLVLCHVLLWFPVRDVLPFLPLGDFGRDLYAFLMAQQGYGPCRDYWWQYGPLVPSYYGFLFSLGGADLMMARLGLAGVYLLISVLAYGALRLLTSPPVAFLASLALINLDMTWTFNHIGAVPFLMVGICFLWKFFLTGKVRWVYFGTIAFAGLALVKVNAGITSFGAFLSSLLIHQWILSFGEARSRISGRHWAGFITVFGTLVLGVYAFQYQGLPSDWVSQCVTASPVYRDWAFSPWDNLKHLILRFLVWEPQRIFAAGILSLWGFLAYRGMHRGALEPFRRKTLFLAILSLFLFSLSNSTEYFLMEGKIYRFDFWILPPVFLLGGVFLEGAEALFSKGMRIGLAGLLLAGILFFPVKRTWEAFAWRTPDRYLDFPNGKVYLGGLLSSVEVVKEATHFILEHTAPGDEILALPYDPVYCFLSGRRQAVRELLFMEHIRISEKQEKRMIEELEKKRTPLVLISSRFRSTEKGVGLWGVTHCRRLNRYLSQRYQEARRIGPWESDPRTFHSVRILLRKPG